MRTRGRRTELLKAEDDVALLMAVSRHLPQSIFMDLVNIYGVSGEGYVHSLRTNLGFQFLKTRILKINVTDRMSP